MSNGTFVTIYFESYNNAFRGKDYLNNVLNLKIVSII